MMRRFFVALLAVFIATTAAAPAFAQDASARFLQTPISDEIVDQVLAAVTQNITSALDENGRPLPPLSAEQQQRPLLERDLVREIMDLGIASGVGQACGLDWGNTNFLPLMYRERSRGDRSSHQLAAIAMVHGLMQSQMAGAGSCGPNGAAAAADFYRRKWGQLAPAGN
jgi:hypothetical protein